MSGGKLPEGWVGSILRDVLDVNSGVGFPIKFQGKNSGDYPVYKVSDISLAVTKNNGNLSAAGHYISKEEAVELKGKIFRPGSTAFAKIGEAVKLNRRAIVQSPGLADNNVMVISAVLHEMDKFIFHFMNTIDLSDQARSTTVPSIRKGDIENIGLDLPSIYEQKIIAEKLDALLAQVDSTKARLEQIPQILKRFRQAVLAAAARGELTKDWYTDPNLVSAKSILNEIETERNQAKNNKLIKQSFGKYKDISPLFHVPSKSWEWVCLEQICATNNNALKAGPFGSALKKVDCVEVGYKVYGQEQVISGNESLETYRINDDKYEQLKSCTTGPGDILISLVGTIGKVLVLSSQAEVGIINPRLVKITLHNTISPQYIKTYLDSPVSHSFFKGFSHGGTMEILNLSILKELPIALPPLEEQHEIVRRVEQLFAYADTIEKQVNNALARVNNLTQSILAKAFRGELTAHWRAENPDLISGENSAAALLEKIKAERAASGGKKTSRKKA